MAWSDLPIELLCCISSHLSVVDLIRLSVVCTSWNFTPANYAHLGFQCRPSPWLLISNEVEEASDTLTFREITLESEEAIVSFHRHFNYIGSHTSGFCCIGSKDGWLVTLEKINLQPRLVNPITKEEILLPSFFTLIGPQYAPGGSIRISYNEIFLDFTIDDFCDLYFHKIIVSSNDSSGTVVVIFGITKELALARLEGLAWVDGPQLSDYNTNNEEQFEDVCYHEENQRFYAITNFSMILSFDLNGQNVELICPSIPNPNYHADNFDYMCYITFFSGNILRIERLTNITLNSHHYGKTMAISVFKFVPTVITTTTSSSYSQWIPVNELEEYSYFVGTNQTFYLHHKFATGIKPNCIYFADHSSNMFPINAECDVGVFDLYNDHIQNIILPYSRTSWPPSIWFTPSLL